MAVQSKWDHLNLNINSGPNKQLPTSGLTTCINALWLLQLIVIGSVHPESITEKQTKHTAQHVHVHVPVKLTVQSLLNAETIS